MNTKINQVSLENIEQSNDPPKQFTFDAVYAEDSITENLYAESVFPLVESVCWHKELKRVFILVYFRYSKAIMQLFLLMVKPGKSRLIDYKSVCIYSWLARCGKSFTMQGINTPGSPQRGVIPRSFEVKTFVYTCAKYRLSNIILAYI